MRSGLWIVVLTALLALSVAQVPLDPSDEEVMRELLFALDFAQWIEYRTNFESPCNWTNVVCEDGRIVSILVDSFGSTSVDQIVTGYLPESIGRLSALRNFEITCDIDVPLHGSVPYGLVNGSMPNLITVVIAYCGLASNVSLWDLSLPGLICADLQSNRIYGDISGLQCAHNFALNLENNTVTGVIPWAGCPTNSAMQLSYNRLTGLGRLPVGTCKTRAPPSSIDFSNNRLRGNLSDIEGIFECFTTVLMSSNRISSTLPASYWKSPTLDFSNNNLYGTLPSVLDDKKPREVEMNFNFNQLTGTLPVFPPSWTMKFMAASNLFTNITASLEQSDFHTLLVPGNEIEGEFAFELPPKLRKLNVAHNRLSGCPFTTCQGPNFNSSTTYSSDSNSHVYDLTSLIINNNNFSCRYCVPRWANAPFADLQLEHLDVSYNDLSAITANYLCAVTIVANHANLTSMADGVLQDFALCSRATFADLSFNNLTGPLPALDNNDVVASVIVLDVSYNYFYGGIYAHNTGGSYSSQLASSYTSSAGYTSDGLELQLLNITGNLITLAESTALLYASTIVSFVGPDYTCPAVQITGLAVVISVSPTFYNYSACFCDELFFGAATTDGQGYKCTSLGVICDDLICFDLDNTTVRTIMANPGYYPRPTPGATQSFLPCPTIDPSKVTYACTGQCACTGAIDTLNCTCDDICSPGYEGLFCSQCASGYYALGLICLECDNAYNEATMIIAGASFAMTVLSMVASAGPAMTREPGNEGCVQALWRNRVLTVVVFIQVVMMFVASLVLSTANMGVVGVCIVLSLLMQLAWNQTGTGPRLPASRIPIDISALTILITYGQIIAAGVPAGFWTFQAHAPQLESVASLPPFSVYGPEAAHGIGQLTPFGAECFYADNTAQVEIFFYWMLVAPIICLTLIGLSAMLARLRLSCGSSPEHLAAQQTVGVRAQTAVMYIINYLVFNAFIIVIQLFNCNQMGSEPYQLEAYPFIQCYEGAWVNLLYVTVTVLGGYVLAFAFFAWRMRSVLRKEGVDVVRSRFAFFVAPFGDHKWWFGLIILARRLLLAVGLSGFPNDSSMGPLMVLATLVAGLVLQTTAWPYTNTAHNWMETLQLALLIVTYAAVELLNAGFVLFSTATRALLLTANGIFVVGAILYAMSPAVRRLCLRRVDIDEDVIILGAESSPLLEHVSLNRRARLNSEVVRMRELEQENAMLRQSNSALRQRNATLETENDSLRRRPAAAAVV